MWTWLAGSAIGGAVVAIPDTGPRLFSFSETHGPSALDLVGMVLLVASWVPIAALIWSERRLVRGTSRRWAAVLAVVGAALLVVTIGLDLGPSWFAAVALLVAAQAVALRAIARGTGGP